LQEWISLSQVSPPSLIKPPRLKVTIGQAFLPILHNRDPFIFIESPRGCLKTCSILNILMFRAYRWPGKRWYIWRSTRTLLSTTVLRSFQDYVIPEWSKVRGMRLLNPKAGPSHRTSYEFENGSEVIPIGMDDILRGTSAEAAGGYLAEAIELDNLDQATALVGMMRQPGVPFHQIMVDVNPGPPAHWTNRIAEPIPNELRCVETRADYDRLQEYNARPAKNPTRRWKRIVAKIQDNPFYFDVDRWELLPPGKAYLNALGVLSGHMYHRWVLGEWKAAEGGVFPEFDETKHVVRPFVVPKTWPCVLAEDPGYDHPTAILLCAIAPNGRKYFVREFVKRQTTVKDDSDVIHVWSKDFNIRKKLGDPHYMFSANKHNSGVPVSVQMGTLGHSFEHAPAAHNPAELDAQVQVMRSALLNTLKDGEPEVQVFDTCPALINAYQSWSHKRSAKGEITGSTDRYEEQWKDEMDAARMILASLPEFSGEGYGAEDAPDEDEVDQEAYLEDREAE
jgi:hypothetical protein